MQKIVIKLSKNMVLGSGIRDPIPDPGVKKAPDPDPQHWVPAPVSYSYFICLVNIFLSSPEAWEWGWETARQKDSAFYQDDQQWEDAALSDGYYASSPSTFRYFAVVLIFGPNLPAF